MTHETDAIVTRIMSIRNGMILDADAEALIRDALDARGGIPSEEEIDASGAPHSGIRRFSPETETLLQLVRNLRAHRIMCDGGNGNVYDIADDDCEQAADFIEMTVSRGHAPTPADDIAKLIADKAAEPAFVEFAKNMPQLNEVLYLPIFKVGPTAVTHWRVALMSGREIGLSDDELKTAVSQSSTLGNSK